LRLALRRRYYARCAGYVKIALLYWYW